MPLYISIDIDINISIEKERYIERQKSVRERRENPWEDISIFVSWTRFLKNKR